MFLLEKRGTLLIFHHRMAPLTRGATGEKVGEQVFGEIMAELKPFDVESILASMGPR
jgi:hypothetical protein